MALSSVLPWHESRLNRSVLRIQLNGAQEDIDDLRKRFLESETLKAKEHLRNCIVHAGATHASLQKALAAADSAHDLIEKKDWGDERDFVQTDDSLSMTGLCSDVKTP